jgi:hypothetical protein
MAVVMESVPAEATAEALASSVSGRENDSSNHDGTIAIRIAVVDRSGHAESLMLSLEALAELKVSATTLTGVVETTGTRMLPQ